VNHHPLLPLLAALTGALCSCAWLGDDQAESPAPNPNAPKLVGRIAAIPADRRFVYIQSYGKWSAAPGTILTTRGPDGRTANLLATGESLSHYAAADLQSGTLAVGDAVYSLAATASATTSNKPDDPAPKPSSEATPPPPPPTPAPSEKLSEPPENQTPENSKKNNQPF
jgi:hypothetical protein